MGVCNEDCNCLVEGEDGIETNGLGSAASPYVIGTEANRMIPIFGTAAARTALSVSASDVGLVYIESDTGRAFLYAAGAFGWVPIAPEVYQATGGANFTAGTDVYQTFASLSLTAGLWMLWGKGYVATQLGSADPVTERFVTYTARLTWVTLGTDADISLFHGDIGPHAISGANLAATAGIIERRAFSLAVLVRLAAADTLRLDVKRSDDAMSAGMNQIKIQAMRCGYSSSV